MVAIRPTRVSLRPSGSRSDVLNRSQTRDRDNMACGFAKNRWTVARSPGLLPDFSLVFQTGLGRKAKLKQAGPPRPVPWVRAEVQACPSKTCGPSWPRLLQRRRTVLSSGGWRPLCRKGARCLSDD
eukprot:4520176-Pyramimonas_sp.AAC.2